jgi:hypothetical protein
MSSKKISQLAPETVLDGTMVFPLIKQDPALLVPALSNIKATLDALRSFIFNQSSSYLLTGNGSLFSLERLQAKSFNTFVKNLNDYAEERSYDGAGRLIEVKYTITPGTEIKKEIIWSGSKVDKVVLSGAIPSGIPTTRTYAYDPTSGLHINTIYS